MKSISNRIFTIASLILVSCLGWGQSNIRPDHYWDNPYYITPAFINNQYVAIISAAGRKQWINVDGAPKTIWLTGAYYSDDKHMQIGVKLFQDRIGYISTSNFSLSYAFAAVLNEDWRLDMGIAGSYQRVNYDQSKIISDNPGDPAFAESFVNRQGFNADIGIEITSKIFKLGIASQNIAGWISKSNFKSILPNTNPLYCTYRLCTENVIDYNFGLSEYNYLNLFQHEISCMAIIKNQMTDAFNLGLFYRYKYEIGATLGVNINKSFSVTYSYNYNTSAIKYNTAGSHELILTYRIKPKPVCYSCF